MSRCHPLGRGLGHQYVPTGETATGLMPGDILLFHRRGRMSWCIRQGERLRLRPEYAKWSHVATYTGGGMLVEATTRGVHETPLEAYRGVEYAVVHTGLSARDAEQAVAYLRSCVGDGYGWLVVLSAACRMLAPRRVRKAWEVKICSGLAAQAQTRGWATFADPANITPGELAEHYGVL